MASASVVLTSDTSGSVTVTVPSGTSIGTTTLTLPTSGGTIQTSGSGFTTNGVAYASSTSALTTGSSLVWTGSALGVGVTSPVWGVDISNSTGAGFRYKSTTGSGTIVVDSTGTGAGGSGISCRKNGTAYAVFGVSGWINGDTTTDAQIFADGSSGIRFCVAGSVTPVGTFDSNGALLVGTTTSGGWQGNARGEFFSNVSSFGSPGGVALSVYQSGSSVVAQNIRVNATSTAFIQFQYNGATTVGSITTNGSTTSYNTSSDYRLKNTIAPMTGALAKVALLKPVTYKWNSDGSDGQGFIAHELQEVVPECVTGEKDGVDEDGNPRHQGVDTSFLVATLTSAIQELSTLITAQQSTIQSLTERITALEGART